jgi:hypothetical protein
MKQKIIEILNGYVDCFDGEAGRCIPEAEIPHIADELEQALQQTPCSTPLPPILPFVELALNTGQAELRSMYKRVGINGSNVLDLIDETLDKVQAAMA